MKQLFRGYRMAITPHNNRDAGISRHVQDRLLDAAEELFCDHGFEATTIRDIAAAADCNIASINYYFGSKENLYTEVWRRHLNFIRTTRMAGIDKAMSKAESDPVLEDLLTSFANSFVEPMADESRTRRLIKLMTRETLDQHLPSHMFVDEVIRPTMAAMQQALLKTCPALDPLTVPFVVFCLVGQIVHAIHIRAMFDQRDKPDLPIFDLDQVVKHIVKFSAAGIRAFTQEKAK